MQMSHLPASYMGPELDSCSPGEVVKQELPGGRSS